MSSTTLNILAILAKRHQIRLVPKKSEPSQAYSEEACPLLVFRFIKNYAQWPDLSKACCFECLELIHSLHHVVGKPNMALQLKFSIVRPTEIRHPILFKTTIQIGNANQKRMALLLITCLLKQAQGGKKVAHEYHLQAEKHATIFPSDCIFGRRFHTKVSSGAS